MTASAAKKYFGNEDPIGKVVDFNKEMRLKVTGIAADVPVNSHLDFDMVVPLSNWKIAHGSTNGPIMVYMYTFNSIRQYTLNNCRNSFLPSWINTWVSFTVKRL